MSGLIGALFKGLLIAFVVAVGYAALAFSTPVTSDNLRVASERLCRVIKMALIVSPLPVTRASGDCGCMAAQAARGGAASAAIVERGRRFVWSRATGGGTPLSPEAVADLVDLADRAARACGGTPI